MKLHSKFNGNGDRASRVTAEELRTMRVGDETIRAFEAFRTRWKADLERNRLEREQIAFVLYEDAEYPALLREISDPPYALFIRGNADLGNLEGAAIVGTRRNTAYGRHVARWIGEELGRAGIPVVSGLAGGIDAITHEAAHAVGGRCVAVIGSGVDNASIYPRTNVGLAMRILESGGSVVSELPLGTQPLRYHFPMRNRILSGVSRITVVVEAAEKSGSLITAFQALEQNRDVFAVPGPITNEQSKGANKLLGLGAIPCTSPEDLIARFTAPPCTGRCTAPPRIADLTDEDRAFLHLLGEPRHVDEIGREMGCSSADVASRIVRLELRGFVAAQGGNIYVRTPSSSPLVD